MVVAIGRTHTSRTSDSAMKIMAVVSSPALGTAAAAGYDHTVISSYSYIDTILIVLLVYVVMITDQLKAVHRLLKRFSN